MNPWKALVIKHKAKSIKPIPEGWLTRAQVAEKIGCSESRVPENLRAAVKAKDVLVEKFPVWDALEGKVAMVQCYTLSVKKAPEVKTKIKTRWPYPEGTRVRRHKGGEGVMLSGGKVQWDSGTITQPRGSTFRRIFPV
jgi:hypothetical protein